ncbi:MAG: hypothetical protein SPL04_00920 [Candidatus Onthomorpha sp.]|nr:hypothetical protein [Candidatus Onthomorpha sp.]
MKEKNNPYKSSRNRKTHLVLQADRFQILFSEYIPYFQHYSKL